MPARKARVARLRQMRFARTDGPSKLIFSLNIRVELVEDAAKVLKEAQVVTGL
jgi:hypothetical protein